MTVWISALFGLALGLANAVASYVLYRRARGTAQGMFMKIVFGGMLARLVLVLALMTLVLVLLPVSRLAFAGGFFLAFAAGMAVEVLLIQRHAPSAKAQA